MMIVARRLMLRRRSTDSVWRRRPCPQSSRSFQASLRRQFSDSAHAQGTSAEAAAVVGERPAFKVLLRHFICCAVPMVGFGFMDNSILIRAGDAIDNHLGDSLDLEPIQSAAIGQIFSDGSGVLFGGVIESLSRNFILPPMLNPSQVALRITQLTGTAGAFVGVVVGCILGMTNFLFMDLKEAARLKKMEEMQVLVKKIVNSAVKMFGAGAGTIFLVDEEQATLWSFGATGIDHIIRVPLTANSLCGWVALNNQDLIIDDAYADSRFGGREHDKRTGFRTKSVLAIPVRMDGNPEKVIAVIQLLNKPTGFDKHDLKMSTMMADHAAVFLSEFTDSE